MATVALIGADGAGKTTVGRLLEQQDGLAVKYLYLGVNIEASNHLLPTTRLARWIKRRRGRHDDAGPPPDVRSIHRSEAQRSLAAKARSAGRLVNRIADEWYRQFVAWRYQRRGFVVVFDRHYLADFASHDVRTDVELSLDRRIHGFLLRHLYPRPDLVVFLDAPPQVLLDRKGEGTLDDLARRRVDYLELAATSRRFERVDAARPIDAVVADVCALVAGVR